MLQPSTGSSSGANEINYQNILFLYSRTKWKKFKLIKNPIVKKTSIKYHLKNTQVSWNQNPNN